MSQEPKSRRKYFSSTRANRIKRLRLKKSCQYLLFVDEKNMSPKDAVRLGDELHRAGFKNIIALTHGKPEIRVIEKDL